jgi:ribose transport system substrate-binding protein
MNLSRLLSMLLVPAVLLGMAPGCKQESGKIKVAIVTNNPEEFWSFCDAGARKAAEKNGVELIFRKPDKGDVTVQMDIVKALESQGVAGMAVSVINPEEQAPELKLLSEKMKLVTMDNDADGSGRICYIGTDNYAAGHEVGRLVGQILPEGGTLAVFVGQASPLNARQRFWGLVDELNGKKDRTDFANPHFDGLIGGKYKLYENGAVTDGANREQAQINAAQALAKIGSEPNVCMIGLWAYNPPKILEAVLSDARYKHVKIVGFDEAFETLDGIMKGHIYATVVQDPYRFGFQSVEVLAAEARGDTSKRVLAPIPYRVVTKDGGAPKIRNGVEIMNLKAADFSDHLKQLLAEVK